MMEGGGAETVSGPRSTLQHAEVLKTLEGRSAKFLEIFDFFAPVDPMAAGSMPLIHPVDGSTNE